ncbi:DDE-type integrase/transposase/recombinase [Microbacterium laevaniformans]|nr:DDE-type integrase/transposase/recombinase [Microbacterium laevaniformans]
MTIHPGDIIRWQGGSHQVVAIRPTYLTLRAVDGDGYDVEVLAADLQHEAEPAAPASLRSLLDLRSLQDLDARDRKIVDVWLEELARFDKLVATGVTKPAARQQVIDSVNRRLGTDYSPVKVSRQQRALEVFGVSGLLDRRRHGLADMPGRSYDERLIDAILTVQAGQERKSTGTGTRLIWLVRRELDDRFGEGVVPMPSRATMYRLLSELDAGKHTLGTARTRRTTANQPDHMHGVRSGVRPGERVLIDTTPMEILVECDGEPVRPDLTLLLCEASRSVLSGIVTVGSRSIDLVVVLARALVPYASRPDGVRANRRQVSEAWTGTDGLMIERFEAMRDAQPYVFPESITTDRGASYVSRHFSDACRTLGISLTVNAEYSPTQKAKIERMFRTVKDLFTQYAIAFLGQSTEMRGDEIVPTSQLLTLEQLQELFEDWVAVTWQNRPHKALRDPRNPRLMLTPNQMVAAYREIAPELQVPLTAEKYIALLPTKWRVINHYGVDIDLRVYDSTELGPLRKKRSPHHRQQGKWPFHVDPYNPMTVWLELGDQFLPLDWRSPYSGAPMADEVWRIARAQAAARGESEPSTDDLNEVMRRFMYKGNAMPTKRQKKRSVSAQMDPLAITNQLAHIAPAAAPGGELSAAGDVGDKEPDVVAAKPAWPVAAPFGMTRSPDEA